MKKIKTGIDLAEACVDVAKNYKTLYIMGCFGSPMTAANKDRYTRNHEYNQQTVRTTMIKAASASTFGFDCVNLIKGLLWGWNADKSHSYGGAKYQSNGVPDIGADQMIKKCKDRSADFSKICIGEAVWMKGHIGVYIGDGLCVECTPAWKNGVQITAVHNIGKVAGRNGRTWTEHGKLPYVTYEEQKPSSSTSSKAEPVATETVYIVKERDTLTKIAKKYGTTVVKLVEYNGIANPDLIQVGQKIKIPGAAAPITHGCKVIIRAGATYGGLSTARGKAVPASVYNGKKYTVVDLNSHKGVMEARLKEINSWVAVSSLTVV